VAEVNRDAIVRERAAPEGFMVAFIREGAELALAKAEGDPHTLVPFSSCLLSFRQDHRDGGGLRLPQLHAGSRQLVVRLGRSARDYWVVIDAGPEKADSRVRFIRYQADGTAIGRYRSHYKI
jgi:hypothetical protein